MVVELGGRREPSFFARLPAWLLALHPALALHVASGVGSSLTLLLLVLTLRLFAEEELRFGQGQRMGRLSSLPKAGDRKPGRSRCSSPRSVTWSGVDR